MLVPDRHPTGVANRPMGKPYFRTYTGSNKAGIFLLDRPASKQHRATVIGQVGVRTERQVDAV